MSRKRRNKKTHGGPGGLLGFFLLAISFGFMQRGDTDLAFWVLVPFVLWVLFAVIGGGIKWFAEDNAQRARIKARRKRDLVEMIQDLKNIQKRYEAGEISKERIDKLVKVGFDALSRKPKTRREIIQEGKDKGFLP